VKAAGSVQWLVPGPGAEAIAINTPAVAQ
jgi:hypothetical protein